MIFRYILQNCRNPDGSFTITEHEMRSLRIEYVTVRRLAFKLMREFKRQADKYLIPTRWNWPYRAVKDFFKRSKGR